MDAHGLSTLIARIYDTSLSPESWPEVLDEVSFAFGASGALIFEVLEGEEKPRVIAPYFSSNYDQNILETYLTHFSDFELRDQIKFAEAAGVGQDITLINDVDVLPGYPDVSKYPHIEQYRKFKIGHRSGTVLNKDCWNIDRFSFQYGLDRGPATADEKKLADLILRHIAKALRIGRPLIQQSNNITSEIQKKIDNIKYGIALITPTGEKILTNSEFDRIVNDTNIIKLSSHGRLELCGDDDLSSRFRHLISSDQAHGHFGAKPRHEAIVIPHSNEDGESIALIEVTPAHHHPALDRLPAGAKLVTIFDSTRHIQIDSDLVRKFFPITESEKEILELICLGLSNTEIAEMRQRAVETINSQTKSLLRKTYSKNRIELVQLSVSLKSPFSTSWI